jgi:hypothetical protein
MFSYMAVLPATSANITTQLIVSRATNSFLYIIVLPGHFPAEPTAATLRYAPALPGTPLCPVQFFPAESITTGPVVP